jgi:hypothetical protein
LDSKRSKINLKRQADKQSKTARRYVPAVDGAIKLDNGAGTGSVMLKHEESSSFTGTENL